MLKNYINTAWRNIVKHKTFSLINIFGLSVGMACCILITLYVQDELSYDRFHENSDRIYRISTNIQSQNSPEEYMSLTSRPVVESLKEFPEVEGVVRLNQWNPVLKKDNELFYDDTYYFAEADFFNIFSFDLIKGDPTTALEGINKVVISESMLKKYFGKENVLGQTIVLNDTNVFEVSGVIRDVPAQSHFDFDFLVSYETLLKASPVQPFEWLSLSTYSYLLLKKGADPEDLRAKAKPLIMDNFGEQLKAVGYHAEVDLESLSELYLYSKKSHPIGSVGDIMYVYIFSAVAAFILILACINFMNLSTAKSLERAKEVGVRKVLGSYRASLIGQFLSESMFISIICLLLALIIVLTAIPGLNTIAGKEFSYTSIFSLFNIQVMVGITLLVGFLAGLYPAFVLSSFKPTVVLKGAFKTNSSGILLRKVLIIFQFVISIGLLIGAIIAYKQLVFMQEKDLGFDKSNMLVINGQRLNLAQRLKYDVIKDELSKISGVKSITASGSVPGKSTSELITVAEGLPEGESVALNILPVDYDFFEVYNVKMSNGRNFSREITTDETEGFIINQAAVHKLGYASEEEALGKKISFANKEGKVIGIANDFNYFSLKQPLTPMLFFISPQGMIYYSVKLESTNLENVAVYLEEKWKSLFPGYTFQYSFLDEEFNNQYALEEKMNKVLAIFTGLAILIACLGLFGLVAFTVLLKTKEIGVRKVLGATEKNILGLLGNEFGKLILVSFILAVPLALYLMNNWLAEFSYRISPGVDIVLIAGVLTFVTTVLTVGSLAIKAAWANPVESLKSE